MSDAPDPPPDYTALLADLLARVYDASWRPSGQEYALTQEAQAIPREMLEARLKQAQAVMVRDHVSRVHGAFLRKALISIPARDGCAPPGQSANDTVSEGE